MKDGIQPHHPESLNELMEMTERISPDEDLIRSLEDTKVYSIHAQQERVRTVYRSSAK